jgi:dihydrofolate reductase
MSMSLDGYVAGPNPSMEHPLGEGGEQLHQWAFAVAAWRERHGLSGGDRNPDSEVVDESVRDLGATIMGRGMFSGGHGSWTSDPNANGWWGDDPPFHHPVFVLTHHAHEPIEMAGGTTFFFVTEGIESALEQAAAAAGGADVRLGGGPATIREYLRAGLVDELHVAVVPLLLGAGERLLGDGVGTDLTCAEFVATPSVAHYRFVRG